MTIRLGMVFATMAMIMIFEPDLAKAQDQKAASKQFKVGAGLIDISPTKFPVIVNGNFTEQSSNKVTDRLHARCMVLDDGQSRLALVVVDTCMMPRALIDQAKEMAFQKTQIPTDHIMVSATHTHSAPACMACLGSRKDEAYAATLPGKIAESVEQAMKNLQPARVGWTSVADWKHTFNRRWIRRPDRMLNDPFGQTNVRANMHPGHQSPDAIGPSGPVDPGLTILSIQTPEGRPLALFANYSQHYYGSPAVSSDYYGRYAVHLAKLLNTEKSGFVAMMSQGTSGDLMWMDYGSPRNDIGYDAYALEMAKVTIDACKTIKYQDWVPLGMAEAKLTLNFRIPDAKRLAQSRELAAKVEKENRLPRTQPEIYAFEQIYLHERPQAELKMQGVRIGDFSIATMPNEVFCITGLKVKAQSPFGTTCVVELANGAEGYIPPPEQHHLGGYTTWPARTAGLEVSAEPQITEQALTLLEKVAGRSRRPREVEHGTYAQAILKSRPSAYWKLEDIRISHAMDSSGNERKAQIEPGIALYLHGVERQTQLPPPENSVFTGKQINRAFHFAGGRLAIEGKRLPFNVNRDGGSTYSVEFWFWNGLPHDARPITGYLFSKGVDGDKDAAGDHLGIGGTANDVSPGCLFFYQGNVDKTLLKGQTVLKPKTWNHVVVVRDLQQIRVYLNGGKQPEIQGTAKPVSVDQTQSAWYFGGRNDRFAGLEGKMDEVAVYDRALDAEEIADHHRAAGF